MRVALVVILLAIVIVPSAVILVMALVAYFRTEDYDLAEQRRARGECAACGYDLRESRETCPECGTAAPAKGSGSGPRLGAGGK